MAPRLFGHDPAELHRTVDGVLADHEAVPLSATPMARVRAYATATVIATEQAIAAAVDVEVTRADTARRVDEVTARRAVAGREELGVPLTVGQRAAVLRVTTSGRGTELVVGVAGAGHSPIDGPAPTIRGAANGDW